MPRPLGLPKSGGRTKGARNKKSILLRETLELLGCDIPKMIIELLPQLTPEKQADVLMNFMKYIYPMKKAVEHTLAEPTTPSARVEIIAEPIEDKMLELRRLLKILALDQTGNYETVI